MPGAQLNTVPRKALQKVYEAAKANYDQVRWIAPNDPAVKELGTALTKVKEHYGLKEP